MYLVAAVNKPLVKDLLESPPMNMYNREPLSFVEWRGKKRGRQREGKREGRKGWRTIGRTDAGEKEEERTSWPYQMLSMNHG